MAEWFPCAVLMKQSLLCLQYCRGMYTETCLGSQGWPHKHQERWEITIDLLYIFFLNDFLTTQHLLVFTVTMEDPIKEVADMMDNNKEEGWEKSLANKQVTFVVYREGDQLNFFRVVDRGDGTLTPLSESIRLEECLYC